MRWRLGFVVSARFVVGLMFACVVVRPTLAAETDRIATVGARLIAAYPHTLDRVEAGRLVWKDGTRMAIDDGKGEKSFEQRLAEPDLEDMFYAEYPAGPDLAPPAQLSDPGRVRFMPFFEKLYGDCLKNQVAGRLVTVQWLPKLGGGTVRVHPGEGVADRLRAVSAELEALPQQFHRYLMPSAGTYNCRPIAGTNRVSAHGLGIAIDLNVAHADYWRWTKPGSNGVYLYRNRIPPEIVTIFERHGFIWGGKWYHYDTMHFEYRPELLSRP